MGGGCFVALIILNGHVTDIDSDFVLFGSLKGDERERERNETNDITQTADFPVLWLKQALLQQILKTEN